MRARLDAWTQLAFFALIVRPFMMLFIGLRVRGRGHLPERDPFVVIANHSSHLDAAVILSLFPLRRLHRIRPVAAADYFSKNELLSWFARAAMNILPIARERVTRENDPRRPMLEELDLEHSLILFPEGTRGSGDTIGAFHGGIVHLVRKHPGLQVVPVYLHNLGRSLPKGQWIPIPVFCEARVGAPIVPTGDKKEVLATLEAAVRALAQES